MRKFLALKVDVLKSLIIFLVQCYNLPQYTIQRNIFVHVYMYIINSNILLETIC